MVPQKGQLGHGDLRQRNVPTIVAALKNMTVIAGACGKNHSAVVTSTGDSWACGLNSQVSWEHTHEASSVIKGARA